MPPDHLNDAAKAFRPNTALKRDGVGQIAPTDTAVPAQPSGPLHLSIWRSEEFQDTDGGEFDRAAPLFVVTLALVVTFSIGRLDLPDLG